MTFEHTYAALQTGESYGSRDLEEHHSYGKCNAPNVPRLYLCIGFLCIPISFFFGLFLGSLHWPFDRSNVLPQYQSLDMLNSLVPKFPIEEYKTFDFDRTFMQPPGDNDTAAWVSMIPKGKGIVKLPTGKPFPDDTFNLAVYHQLHCLYTLKQSFWAFYQIMNMYTGESRNTTYVLLHGNHCLEYLRHAVSCNVDTTLEPFDIERQTFRV